MKTSTLNPSFKSSKKSTYNYLNNNSFGISRESDKISDKMKSFLDHFFIPVSNSECMLPSPLEISITPDFTIKLPCHFKDLGDNIEKSKSILDLQDNWDDEESPGYKEETLIQSIKFITNYAEWIWDKLKIVIDPPKILPGPDGSIDLLWRKKKYGLLINIPDYPKKIATFYGDDNKDEKIKGQFDIQSSNQGIFLCLLNQK